MQDVVGVSDVLSDACASFEIDGSSEEAIPRVLNEESVEA